jgi:uncharacterized membrane protein
MNNPAWIFRLVLILMGGLMLALPQLSPRDLYFGVRTGGAFRASQEGKAAAAWYRWCVVIGVIAALALDLILSGLPDVVKALLPLLPFLVAVAAFVRVYFRLRSHALPASGVREADLSEEGGLPWWLALALPPFGGPLAVYAYLRVHWAEIPERFPIHFGMHGEPNAWANRTERAVFAPLWFAVGLLLLMLMLGVAVLMGSRKSARLTGMSGIFIGTMYLLSIIFSGVGLSPLVHVPAGAMLGFTGVFVAIVLLLGFRANADPDRPIEATPDECWTLGGIYNNPDDPAIFVQKRVGFGYTVNFGNVWSYVVLGGFLLGTIGLSLFLRWSLRG